MSEFLMTYPFLSFLIMLAVAVMVATIFTKLLVKQEMDNFKRISDLASFWMLLNEYSREKEQKSDDS